MRHVALAAGLLLGCSNSHAPADSGADLGIDSGPTVIDAGVDAPAPLDAHLGGDVGEPCASSADCRAPHYDGGTWTIPACITEASWVNGYCREFCTSPTVPTTDAPLPQRDCPAGSVCLPTYMSSDVGFCLRSCTADSDCRTAEGYYCRRDFAAVHAATGVCAAPICTSRGCAGGDCSC